MRGKLCTLGSSSHRPPEEGGDLAELGRHMEQVQAPRSSTPKPLGAFHAASARCTKPSCAPICEPPASVTAVTLHWPLDVSAIRETALQMAFAWLERTLLAVVPAGV